MHCQCQINIMVSAKLDFLDAVTNKLIRLLLLVVFVVLSDPESDDLDY